MEERGVSTRILGKAMRDAEWNKERWKVRRTPTQDPSTDLMEERRTAMRPSPSTQYTIHLRMRMRRTAISARFGSQVSTRILGRRAAPFQPSLSPYRVPRGFTQDPSTE